MSRVEDNKVRYVYPMEAVPTGVSWALATVKCQKLVQLAHTQSTTRLPPQHETIPPEHQGKWSRVSVMQYTATGQFWRGNPPASPEAHHRNSCFDPCAHPLRTGTKNRLHKRWSTDSSPTETGKRTGLSAMPSSTRPPLPVPGTRESQNQPVPTVRTPLCSNVVVYFPVGGFPSGSLLECSATFVRRCCTGDLCKRKRAWLLPVRADLSPVTSARPAPLRR
jgi:hypothetical protein|mmetsp:Transcript_87698/g.145771  ORF Transcript_87698/g.145771 Transcript_87698/m.145771 type:complete len:221 (-) Transcript_87698:1337-1999(-)